MCNTKITYVLSCNIHSFVINYKNKVIKMIYKIYLLNTICNPTVRK